MSDDLRAEIDRALAPCLDDPERLFRRRAEFYRRWGHGGALLPAGYGRAELDFMRWEIDRGLLNPLDHPTAPGSPYWRATNLAIARDSELAALARLRGLATPEACARWGEYLARPSAARWYRAHTTSLTRAMAAHAEEGGRESAEERRFINAALYRVLDAEVLVMGGALGALGRLVADPRGPAVRAVVGARSLYPARYPLPRGARPGGGAWRAAEWVLRRYVARASAVDEVVGEYLAPMADGGADELRGRFTEGTPVYPRADRAGGTRTASA